MSSFTEYMIEQIEDKTKRLKRCLCGEAVTLILFCAT